MLEKKKKVCPVCTYEFIPNRANQIYCGPMCSRKVQADAAKNKVKGLRRRVSSR